jgi:hypothetical protein
LQINGKVFHACEKGLEPDLLSGSCKGCNVKVVQAGGCQQLAFRIWQTSIEILTPIANAVWIG